MPAEEKKPSVIIYTDGACSGNPGKGGWGALIIYNKDGKEIKKSLSGGEEQTTNNRMEMMAVLNALKCLKKTCVVELFTDSKYVLEGATKWMIGWIEKGWRNADKKPVKNQDLWQQLNEEFSKHKINWHWVKGHANDEYNNYVDRLAREQCGTF